MKTTVGRLAVFLLIIAGIIAYMTVGVRLFDRVRSSGVRIELTGIDRALQAEKLSSNRYPRDLGAFLRENCESRGSKRVGADPWGRDYGYELRGDGYRVASSGPDRQMGTADDVVLVRDGERMAIESAGGGFQTMAIRSLPAAGAAPGPAALLPGLAALVSPDSLRRGRGGVSGDELAAAILSALGGAP